VRAAAQAARRAAAGAFTRPPRTARIDAVHLSGAYARVDRERG